jgi:hypothetical protein
MMGSKPSYISTEDLSARILEKAANLIIIDVRDVRLQPFAHHCPSATGHNETLL